MESRLDPTIKADLASSAKMLDAKLVMKELRGRGTVDALLQLACAASMRPRLRQICNSTVRKQQSRQ